LATVTNLAPAGREVTFSPAEVHVTTRWTAERQAVPVTYRQEVVLRQDSSVLDLRLSIETTLPVAGMQFELQPAAGMRSSEIVFEGQAATISFTRIGSGEPRLRVAVAGGDGILLRTATGGLRIWSTGTQVRLLITDLTAASSPSVTLQWLDPAQLIEHYGVEAVLLARDPTLDARRARMQALDFQMARNFGPYVLLVRQ